ncbi:MAG: peptidoglycan DD-metalloendopeptidase family protein [Patescibacteria group bacterium]
MLNIKTKNLLVFFLIAAFCWPQFVFGQAASDAANQEITELQNQIAAKQKELEEYKNSEEELNKKIKEKQSEQATLKNQISVLNNGIAKTEIEIKSAQLNIDKTALEIKKTTLEIGETEQDINRKKDYLASVMRLIAQNGDKTSLEILLAHKSLSEFLDQIEYIKNLNTSLEEVLGKVKAIKADLEKQNENLNADKKDLEDQKEKLADKKAEISDQKVNKQYILDKTKQSEKEYQKMLAAAKAEQERANSAIVAAERQIRKKLAEQQGISGLKFDDKGFVWPVPQNTITAYFHDPEYPYRHVFEHPAVDIRAGQGTPIRAAATGYVAQAKNAGYGYSYIMVVHGDGLATVYGHVSNIAVQTDQFVAQGQVIGYSGGMPGTPGAGYLTTGPHLHFEVRLNGIPVNPLSYLP